MNKWIPISLFIFLGVFLLTTAHAVDTIQRGIHIAGVQPHTNSNNPLHGNDSSDEDF